MTEPSPDALRLLLRLLEAPLCKVTHAALDYYGRRGRELIESGLLLPTGHDNWIVDEDDGELHVVERVPRRGLGYYSPTHGWTAVKQEQLCCYRPDLGNLFRVLFSDRIRLPRAGPLALDENDRLWDMGNAYVGGKNCSVWFARRLTDERAVQHLAEVHGARPPGDTRIIFTSTDRRKLTRSGLPRGALVSVDDVMSLIDTIRIDPAVLAARISGRQVERVTSGVFLSADDSTLSINGELVLVVRGDKQRRLLRLMVEAHESGQPIRAADIIKRADLAGQSFDKAFGHHWQTLRKHMSTMGGAWRFVV